MKAGAASPPAGAPSRLESEPWVHRCAAGIEVGVELPTGKASSAVRAFRASLALTWSLRETLWVLVLKDFKARYRAQSLGLFWSLAYPLVMMATLTVAFRYVLRVQIENFSVFYLVGAVFWQFFTNASLAGVNAILDNGSLVKGTTFPRFLYPVAVVLSHLIHLGMELVLVFVFYFVFPHAYRFTFTLVALPLLVAVEVLLLIGFALLTSTLHPRFRDLYYVVSSLLTVGFWATPVLYSTDMAPPWVRAVLQLNPLAAIIESARAIVMRGEWPSPRYLLQATAIAVVVFFLGAATYRSQNVQIADFV